MVSPQFEPHHVPDVFCPHCGVSVHPKLVNFDIQTWQEGQVDRLMASCVVRCPRKQCHFSFYVTVRGHFSTRDGGIFSTELWAVWPPPAKRIDERIPDDVAVDFRQAFQCWSTGMIRAGTLILRRCLENACLTAGATEARLEDMIDELADKKVLHPINAQSAHKTRIIGNFTAHVVREITPGELEKTLTLTEKILDDLFVTPALQKEIDTTRPTKTP